MDQWISELLADVQRIFADCVYSSRCRRLGNRGENKSVLTVTASARMLDLSVSGFLSSRTPRIEDVRAIFNPFFIGKDLCFLQEVCSRPVASHPRMGVDKLFQFPQVQLKHRMLKNSSSATVARQAPSCFGGHRPDFMSCPP